MELATLLAIGELIGKYGIPTALNIAAIWSSNITNEPTHEDVERLRIMVPEPTIDNFFEVED